MQSDYKGVLLTFDLDTKLLRDYYSRTSPQGAYEVIERYLKKQKFEHLKDTDYRHTEMSKVEVLKLVADFAQNNKWFPLCLNKMNISPNVPILDISHDIKMMYTDEEWKQEKDAENAEKSQEKQTTLSNYKELIKEASHANKAEVPDNIKDYKKMENER